MQAHLVPPITLSANPDAYDYLHTFKLLESNVIELFAGDGQKIWFEANGSFQLSQQQDAIQLRIYNVRLIDLYDDGEQLPTPQDFECKATIEYGQYFLPDGVPTAQVPERRQYLAFTRRVVFETDPILLASNSVDVTTPSTHDVTERIYYPMNECRRGTLQELSRPRLIIPGQ